jgi:D-glycero-alpha-D-manno-heptose-7-phosphate kinase
LGSSSSFTVGLVHITREYLELGISKRSLAFEACDIEINRLQESIGKQDQYASALGGLNYLIYDKNGEVRVNPIFLESDFSCLIEKNTLLVRTKGTRSANLILQNQSRSVLSETNVENLLAIKNQADSLSMEILSLSAKDIGEALNEGWALKKKVNNLVSNSLVDSQYAELLSMGVYGCKLLGAGGSGYFFVVAEERVIENIQKVFVGLTTKIKVDTLGSTRIYDSRGVQ